MEQQHPTIALEETAILIARGKDVADVMAAVNFAREHVLTLAVRDGGRSGPGLGTCDEGLVVDLSGMKVFASIPPRSPLASKAAAPKARWTMPRIPSGWPLPSS